MRTEKEIEEQIREEEESYQEYAKDVSLKNSR